MRTNLILLAIVAIVTAGTCKSGECCDTEKNTFRIKGTACGAEPCREASFCTGDNPFCPISGKFKVNGTVCPEGVCFNGKCKQVTECVDDCCDKAGKAYLDGHACSIGQCISGKCKALPDCIGSCCDDKGKPISDGAACPEGNCMSGMCIDLNKRCSVGHCCDLTRKILRPKGFKCTNNPCATKTECTGTSEFCPKSTHYLVDGTPCPKGICMSGVCIDEPYNATKVEEQRRLDEHDTAVALQKGDKVIIAGNLAIHHHHVALPVCTTGECCDTERKEVFESGKNCTAKECYVGVCDGKHSGCEYTTAPAGTACEHGHCFDGACVKDCIGMCCDEDEETAKEDGSPCADGFCFRGACIKTCEGECCEPLKLHADTRQEHYRNQRLGKTNDYGVFMQAKVDGSPCSGGNGYCMKGACTPFSVPQYRPQENTAPGVVPHASDVKLFIQSFKERFIKNVFMAAAKVENDKMDDDDLEYLQGKIKKEKEKALTAREKELTWKATKEANEIVNSLETSAKSTKTSFFGGATMMYIIIAVVAVIAVACIIKIVVSRKGSNKSENKYETLKKNEDYDF